MDRDMTAKICANDICQFTESGQCVEGNALDECPYLQYTDSLDVEAPSNSITVADNGTNADASLFRIDGEATLSVSEVSALLKFRRASLVALLGQAEAGKTSLIAEVYDAFQYGNYRTLNFAGSRTLMAFERICHKVRASSKASDLSQGRTDFTDDPTFYHLALSDTDQKLNEILIADRSGETYREVLDTPQRASDCLEIVRATVLNLLVDGARLSDTVERTSVLTECVQLIQTLVHAPVFLQDVHINIVLTKLDCVDESPNKDRAHSDFKRINKLVREQTENSVGTIKTFQIAARPQNRLYPKGYGVETLILNWLRCASVVVPYVSTSSPVTRSIDKLRSSLEAV